MSLPRYAIVVAGGSGVRMGTTTPKQFLPLMGMPLLMHTLAGFHSSGNVALVLVLPASHILFWNELCEKHSFKIPHSVVAGGETRFQSVKNGLETIASDGIVAIHDGVRPLVSPRLIERCFEAALRHGTAVPAIRPAESVRLGNLSQSRHFDREQVWLVQTPQVFKAKIIKDCYKAPWQSSFTDDASVAEWNGIEVKMVEGDENNIKITRPADLVLAESILQNR